MKNYQQWLNKITENESKLIDSYIDKDYYSDKKYLTDFIKSVIKSDSSFSSDFKIILPSAKETEPSSQKSIIKNPKTVVCYSADGIHKLVCKYGTGNFYSPKTFDKKVFVKRKKCHIAAYIFAIRHIENLPVILTGFYNRLEDTLEPDEMEKKGFLHSVCRFSFNGKDQIFDGSHGVIMDADLYMKLFNFLPISQLDTITIVKDIKILKTHDFDCLDYFLNREKVLKACQSEQNKKITSEDEKDDCEKS